MREFRRLDLNSEEHGVPVSRLMATAGRLLAEEAAAMAPQGRVLFLCGKGNNGGDGYAACAHLQSVGRDAVCVAVAAPTGEDSQDWAGRCHGVLDLEAFEADPPEAALVVDCLLGSGLVGAPRSPYDRLIDWMDRRHAEGTGLLACDVPSGLSTGHSAVPDATLTFHAAKERMDAATCGRIRIVDIGIPAAAATDIGFGDLAVGYPLAAASSHKGSNGRVLLVAGGPFTGAPYYASVGAYRAGADLVQAYVPADAAQAVRCYGPEPIVHDAGPGTHLGALGAAAVLEALPAASTLLIGPGLGTHPETMDAVRRILDAAAAQGLPTVIDADALDAVPEDYWARNGTRTVLTPHAKEFEDLAGEPATDEAVQRFARAHGCVVVRKGPVDTVAGPDRTKWCRRGHPTMTVGGTGDVLAGVIATVLARGADPFDAACAGTYLTDVAGELAAAELGDGALALDVADHVPEVLARLG